MNEKPGLQWLLWFAGGVVLLLLIVGSAIFFLPGKTVPNSLKPTALPLEGDFLVTLLRGAAEKTRRVDEPGAVPVPAAGERMHLTVTYNQPACAYFVWLNTQGKVVPLYPWNPDTIEVEDADLAPPSIQPGRLVYNPMTMGNGWKFDKKGGLETVLMLARRTPLGDGARLGTLFRAVPPAKMRDRAEVGILKLDRGLAAPATISAQHRGNADETRETDAALLALMPRLQEHFELIQAVRFAHEGD